VTATEISLHGDPSVVAVTGSTGKAITVAFIQAALRSRFAVTTPMTDPGTPHGIPLARDRARSRHQYTVLELGADSPGRVRTLARLIRPDISVVTGIGWAHLGHYTDRDDLATEKTELLRATGPSGAWVVNGDDRLLYDTVRNLPEASRSTLRRVGFAPENDIRIESVDITRRGTSGTLRTSTKRLALSLAVPGRHFAHAAGFAVAVAQLSGVAVEDALDALRDARPPPGHGEIRSAPGDVLIINDTGGSGPDAVFAAVSLLQDLTSAQSRTGTRIVVLGQLGELGRFSAQLHHRLGLALADTATHVIVLGEAAAPLRAGAVTAGVASERVQIATSAEHAHDLVRDLLRRNRNGPATVLVSGIPPLPPE
jgi:UDP-N-acetylmuramoyl-tripeptide--D-alanyl-D-alanine ligase